MASEEPRTTGNRLGVVIRALVALLISGIALWYAFRDADLEAVGSVLKQTSIPVVAGYVVIQLFLHLARVVRWGLVVAPLGTATPRAIFAAASIGFPAAFFLPLRLGEFVRPVMIARAGVPFAGAMASVTVERIADGLCNLGLFFLFLRLIPNTSDAASTLEGYATVGLTLFGGAMVVLVVIALVRRPALRLIEGLLTPISATFAASIVGLLAAFLDGLKPVSSPGRLAAFTFLTLLYWVGAGLAAWLLVQSYQADLPWVAGPFVVSVVVFAITLPAGPAFVGTLEAGFKAGMQPFGVSASTALAMAIAFHALQIVIAAVVAFFGFMAAGERQRAALSESEAIQ